MFLYTVPHCPKLKLIRQLFEFYPIELFLVDENILQSMTAWSVGSTDITRCFLPADAMPGLYCNHFSLRVPLPSVLSSKTESMLWWVKTDWAIEESLLWDILGLLSQNFGVIIHLDCEGLTNQVGCVWLTLSRIGTTSISINIINKCSWLGSTGSQT